MHVTNSENHLHMHLVAERITEKCCTNKQYKGVMGQGYRRTPLLPHFFQMGNMSPTLLKKKNSVSLVNLH